MNTNTEQQTKDFAPEDNLLGDGFLIRGTVMMVNFTDVPGSSSDILSSQQNIEWALGRECLKLKPARALKILWLRGATDYDGDPDELRNAQMRGYKLSEAERAQVQANVIEDIIITLIKNEKKVPIVTGAAFIDYMRELVERHKPDIVRLSPVDLFIGDCDANWFCDEVEAILKEFRCGAIIMRFKLENAMPIMTLQRL